MRVQAPGERPTSVPLSTEVETPKPIVGWDVPGEPDGYKLHCL